MKDKRSAEIKILHYRGFIVPTKEIYRKALKDLIQIIDENYDEMSFNNLKTAPLKITYSAPIENAIALLQPTVEKLINSVA